MADITPLPLSLDDMVIWMRSHPEQKSKLLKLCSASRQVSESVGAYLHKTLLEEVYQNRGAPSIFYYPQDVESLIKRAAQRTGKTSTQ